MQFLHFNIMVLDSVLASYISAGFLGSLSKAILDSDGHLVFPYIFKSTDGKITEIQLGFVGNVFVGIMTAIIVDHSFAVAFFASMAGGMVLEKGSKRFVRAVDTFFEGK